MACPISILADECILVNVSSLAPSHHVSQSVSQFQDSDVTVRGWEVAKRCWTDFTPLSADVTDVPVREWEMAESSSSSSPSSSSSDSPDEEDDPTTGQDN